MRVQLCYRIFLTCNIFLVNAYANWLSGSDSLYGHVIPGSQYSKAWGKHRILVELNSSTPASIDSKLDLPSRLMQQWFGVSTNAVLNTR